MQRHTRQQTWLTTNEFLEFNTQFTQGIQAGYDHAKAFFEAGVRVSEQETQSSEPYKMGHYQGWQRYLQEHLIVPPGQNSAQPLGSSNLHRNRGGDMRGLVQARGPHQS